jgi:hypothetical protein
MSYDNGFPMETYSDIDQWQEHYTPQQGSFEAGPEILPDGQVYDFEITKAELTKSEKKQETIFKLHVKVISGQYAGVSFARPTWFKAQEALDSLGGDFVLLGLDANLWGKRGKSWSAELIQACPLLVGKRFRGERKNGKPKEEGKPGFPNLYIKSQLSANGPPPPSSPVSPFAGAPAGADGKPLF